MVKYGPEVLHQAIIMTLNKCFEEHIDIHVGKGILTPINKPNKTKGPKEHLRAVTLLPIIRKVLSNIVLERTNDKTENTCHNPKVHIENSEAPQILCGHIDG